MLTFMVILVSESKSIQRKILMTKLKLSILLHFYSDCETILEI